MCKIDKPYYAIFMDPLDYSVLGIKKDGSKLELSMHDTELSNLLRNNYLPTMKLAELNMLSNNTTTIRDKRKYYNISKILISSNIDPNNLTMDEMDKIDVNINLNNNDKTIITNIFNNINSKYQNYDLDNSEFLKHTKSELNKKYNDEVNIFKINTINKGQNSCDTTISYIPVNNDKSPSIFNIKYNKNTEYLIIPNDSGTVDLSFQKLYNKNRIFRFENVHNDTKTDSSGNTLHDIFKHHITRSTHSVFDCNIRCNDGRYLNNRYHCISGEPYNWTVVLFNTNNIETLSKKLNNIQYGS